MLKIKRAYDETAPGDGKRILVDRLWPRGLSKSDLELDQWFKDLAPSNGLRKWFGHEPDKYEEFKRRYIEELSKPERQDMLEHIAIWARNGNVTLIYGAEDTEHNNAKVLAELVEQEINGKAAKQLTSNK